MTYQSYEDIKIQADAWEAAIKTVNRRASDIKKLFDDPLSELIVTACGSPYHLGEATATLWRERMGVRTTVVPASEMMLFPEAVLPRQGTPILLTVSRSGESTETIESARAFAKRFPGRTVLVGCKPESTLEQLSDVSIILPEAWDDVIPQTKSFGGMYLACQYLAALLSGDCELISALSRLPGELSKLLARYEPVIRRVAEDEWTSAVFLGSGPLYGIAAEGNLKLTEMSLTSGAAYHMLEVRHGPRSVIDENTLIVGLGSLSGAVHEMQVLNELREGLGAHVLAFTPATGWNMGDGVEEIPLGLDLPEHALGLLYLPLIQLLGYYRAIRNGVDPDASRNLSAHIQLPEVG